MCCYGTCTMSPAIGTEQPLAPRVRGAPRATARLAVPALASVLMFASLPSPQASAVPLMDGTYSANTPHGSTIWTVSSTCSQAGCFARVVSAQGWSADAQYMGRQWVMEAIGRPDGVLCSDGSTAPANVNWIWDGDSLRGMVRSTHGAACGNPPVPPEYVSDEFWLTKVG
jgi:hypothetical protein